MEGDAISAAVNMQVQREGGLEMRMNRNAAALGFCAATIEASPPAESSDFLKGWKPKD